MLPFLDYSKSFESQSLLTIIDDRQMFNFFFLKLQTAHVDLIVGYVVERYLNDCRKSKTRAITLAENTTGATSAMNQLEFLEISVTYAKLGKNHGFAFASHWLKYWHENF